MGGAYETTTWSLSLGPRSNGQHWYYVAQMTENSLGALTENSLGAVNHAREKWPVTQHRNSVNLTSIGCL